MAFGKALAACALALVLCVPGGALAWGPDGHRLVADVALRFLTPAARSRVDALLAAEKSSGVSSTIKTLSDAALWADDIRSARPATASWHYDDVPVCGAADPSSYCANGDCASARIEAFRAVLANPRSTTKARVEALNFIVHFVADVHQPLHAADNHDRGGNDVHVTLPPDKAPNNLHRAWDTDLVVRFLREPGHGAAALAAAVRPDERTTWSAGTSAGWVAEAHLVATQFAYGLLPVGLACGHPPAQTLVLDDAYYAAAAPMIALQVKRAGVRLAAILNAVLK